MPKPRQPEETRGYKNKNAGNLDRVKGVRWQGELPESEEEKRDPRFCVFKTHQHGIRAIIRTLITYAKSRKARDGTAIDTVREVIERWAPPVENDTLAYVKMVADALGVDPDEQIDILDPIVMRKMVKAIIKHECAGLVYPEKMIDEAMVLAGLASENGIGDVAQTTVATVETAEEVYEKKDVANKLTGVAAAAAALAAAASSAVAEIPKIVKSIDEMFPEDINIIANVWDWLPVGLSAVSLMAIFMLFRQIKDLTRSTIRNEL